MQRRFQQATGYNRDVLLIEGDGTGGFASVRTIFAPPPNTAASDIVVGDFDSNNSVDLAFLAPACGSCPGILHVLYGNGRLGFLDTTPFPATSFPFLTAGDLNSDGRTDLFGIDEGSKQLVTLYGRKDRTFDSLLLACVHLWYLGQPERVLFGNPRDGRLQRRRPHGHRGPARPGLPRDYRAVGYSSWLARSLENSPPSS